MWNFDNLYRESIHDLANGTFGEKEYELNLENGGISLLRDQPDQDENTWKEIQEIEKELASGQIEAPVTEEKSEVEELIKQG